MAVFNDPPTGKKPRIKVGYGTARRARNSIRRLQTQPLSYQMQIAHTMYSRAKYHKYQTPDMRNAMKVYGSFLQTLKRKSKGKRPLKQ